MKFRRVYSLYLRFGGYNLIKQLFKTHILCSTVLLSFFLGFSKKGLEILRLVIQHKTQSKLRRRYNYVLERSKTKGYDSLRKSGSNKVWVCWFQGMDNAPLLVKRCYNSLQKNLTDREIVVVTEENLHDYVEFPQYIIDKWKQGIITYAHFSDLLRLELLIKYGGLWIDSTVLCTGGNIPEYILDSELFFYQILKPGLDGHAIGISSWLISAYSNNKVLLVTRDLLYEYWKKNNFLVDYFLLHTFMEIVMDFYPDERKKVIKVSNSTPHILLLDIFEQYDEQKFSYIKEMTCFHKLSYKFENDDLKLKDTYYDMLINKGNY